MKSEKNPFAVTTFTNPSGEIVFRVSGYLRGQRVRKNFSTRKEAEAERQVLAMKALRGKTEMRTALTRLTDEQLHQAESAFQHLGDNPKLSLLGYLSFALANYKEPEQQKSLSEAVAEYVATKCSAHAKELLSMRQFRSIENELGAFGLMSILRLNRKSKNGFAMFPLKTGNALLSTPLSPRR